MTYLNHNMQVQTNSNSNSLSWVQWGSPYTTPLLQLHTCAGGTCRASKPYYMCWCTVGVYTVDVLDTKWHVSPCQTRTPSTPSPTPWVECNEAVPSTPALLVGEGIQHTTTLVTLSSLQHRWAGPEQGNLWRMRQHIDGDSVVRSLLSWKDRNEFTK